MTGDRKGAQIVLRPFERLDIVPLGSLLRASRISMGLFDEPHTPGEHMGFIAGLSAGCTIMVAALGQQPVGFLSHVRRAEEQTGVITHLFVHPDHQRQGIGAMLLDDALTRFAAPLHLWCFEANAPARALYEGRNFQVVERTDGTRNDEGLPDLLYEWRG